MRIYGKFVNRPTIVVITSSLADGSYVALDVHAAFIRTYSGKPIAEDSKCYIIVYSGQFSFEINGDDGRYLTPDMAKSFVHDLATKDCVDLDDYNYVLYEGLDYSLRPVTIQNEYDDEDYSSIPLIVRIEEE